MIDLSSYSGVESAVFIKWVIPNFETALLSDYNIPITFGGDTYVSIGSLLNMSGTTSELKASKSQLSISLSGIPTANVSDILDNEIKGSSLEVYRGLFDPSSHALLPLPENPILNFKGIVTNYGITDDVDVVSQSATNTITITCNSIVEVLAKKVGGRRTNPVDFPDEGSMNRVQTLSSSNYNFGVPG
jgi:hypothetical protein